MSPRPVRVLLLPLGTPDAPDTASVRRYLAEFLSDRRVIDSPRAIWLPILHGIVLRTRPKRSAHAYSKVWTAEGSPLAVISAQQAQLLEQQLQARYGMHVTARVAMRYGAPSIASAAAEALRDGIYRIIALPMYPQYSSATTGSSVQRLFEIVNTERVVPHVRVVPPYFDHDAYINALVAGIAPALKTADADTLVLSFHGYPKRYIAAGDPYHEHCQHTARAVIERLTDFRGKTLVTYQSQFGREEWLRPFTEPTLKELGTQHSRVVVACPGFTSDCLETLEEVAMGIRDVFMRAGGAHFSMVPCVNTDPLWIDAMSELVSAELLGWLGLTDSSNNAAHALRT